MGTAKIDFPVQNLWLSFHIHIVKADIPIILGIQDMDRLGIIIDNIDNKIAHNASGITTELIRYSGYAYITWDPHLQSPFTTSELHSLHRRLGHPSVDKLSNFLRRSGLDRNPGHTRRTLESIERH